MITEEEWDSLVPGCLLVYDDPRVNNQWLYIGPGDKVDTKRFYEVRSSLSGSFHRQDFYERAFHSPENGWEIIWP